MTNGLANGYWKKSLKTGGSLSLAVFFVNCADPGHIIWSWFWWRHILFGCFGVFLFNELMYLKNWLDNSNGNDKGIGNANNLKLTP